MARLVISLLGAFEARLDGQPLSGLAGDKPRALLAYLAVEADRSHRREELAALLWPEWTATRARANLSQVLFGLRSILGDRSLADPRGDARPSFLSVNPEFIRLNPASDHVVDASALAALLRACDAHAHRSGEECPACLGHLEQAVAIYRGDFMHDLTIGESAAFEEWSALRREQYHRRAMEAMSRLTFAYTCRGDLDRALAYAWRQVELDPWHEDAQRQLMSLLARAGRRSEALAQYRACRHALAQELGVEPEAETVALYEALRQGRIGRAT